MVDRVYWIFKHWPEFLRSTAYSFTIIFMFFEGYEVITDSNLTLSLCQFSVLIFAPGILFFLIDGFAFSGYLNRVVSIPNPHSSTEICLKVGDIFKEEGWKAIGVNDFFDSVVDDDLVASKSLHGLVLSEFWAGNRGDWDDQIKSDLPARAGRYEHRPKGKSLRYPIGSTASASANGEKFLFVALGRTDISNNEASANVESFVCAVREMVSAARAKCAMETLIIPLMGSGLARVGAKHSLLVDLIISAILEESRKSLVTSEIIIVIHPSNADAINLKDHKRIWTNG